MVKLICGWGCRRYNNLGPRRKLSAAYANCSGEHFIRPFINWCTCILAHPWSRKQDLCSWVQIPLNKRISHILVKFGNGIDIPFFYEQITARTCRHGSRSLLTNLAWNDSFSSEQPFIRSLCSWPISWTWLVTLRSNIFGIWLSVGTIAGIYFLHCYICI